MSKTQAVKILNYYGKERIQAHRNNMDWMPDRNSRIKIVDAASKLDGEWPKSLTVAGRELYEYNNMFPMMN